MLAALGVILLYLGALVEVVDISMAVIASLLCVFAVIEYGGSAPWLVFGVTAVLAVILVPVKTTALLYALFFGYYPILKEKFEKLNLVTSWICKEAVFNVAMVAMLASMKFLLLEYTDIPFMLWVIVIALCEVVFVVYDFALSRLISLYVYRLRKRFKINK